VKKRGGKKGTENAYSGEESAPNKKRGLLLIRSYSRERSSLREALKAAETYSGDFWRSSRGGRSKELLQTSGDGLRTPIIGDASYILSAGKPIANSKYFRNEEVFL